MNTKFFMRPGERGRLELQPKIGIDRDSIKWSTTSGVVVLDESQQKTKLDMRVVATGQVGIAIVEFEAKVTNQDRKISHVFEIHNVEAETNDEFNAFARLSRSYRRAGAIDNTPADPAQPKTGEKEAASTATDDRTTMRMGADNPTQAAGMPEKPADTQDKIEPSPVNDSTTTSLGGTIGSSAFGSGAKPTATVYGVDTMTVEAHGDAENQDSSKVLDTHADEKPEDREKLDAKLEEIAELDETLKEEAEKLPSETELSGEPQEKVIEPPQTVDEADSRRTAHKSAEEVDAEKTEADKADADKAEAEKSEGEKSEAKKADAKTSDAEKETAKDKTDTKAKAKKPAADKKPATKKAAKTSK